MPTSWRAHGVMSENADPATEAANIAGFTQSIRTWTFDCAKYTASICSSSAAPALRTWTLTYATVAGAGAAETTDIGVAAPDPLAGPGARGGLRGRRPLDQLVRSRA